MKGGCEGKKDLTFFNGTDEILEKKTMIKQNPRFARNPTKIKLNR